MILITPVLFLLHVKMSAVKKTKKKTLPLWAVPTLKLTLLDVYLIGDFSGVFTNDFTVSG